jgi:hypothetical protein
VVAGELGLGRDRGRSSLRQLGKLDNGISKYAECRSFSAIL